MTEDESAHDDIWNASRGYTPLSDLRSSHVSSHPAPGGGTLLCSVGPSIQEDDDDDNDSKLYGHTGAFFVDLAAFTPASVGESDDDDDKPRCTELAVDGCEPMMRERDLADRTSAADFRAIADQALFALEDDYRTTLDSNSSARSSGPTVETDEKLPTPIVLAFETENTETEWQTSFERCKEEIHTRVANGVKSQPEADSTAVLNAVRSIREHNPALERKLHVWEQQHRQESVTVPHTHRLVPAAPLSAFRKNTAKAQTATAHLSRAATIAHALVRLDVLRSQETLSVHVVGCDAVECATDETVRLYFGPLARWLAVAAEAPKHLELHLIGPNIPIEASQRKPMQLLSSAVSSSRPTRLKSAKVSSHLAVYDDYECNTRADLIVCFNAGIWGYTEWKPTLHALALRKQNIPFIATAYTLLEAEDDEDTILDVLKELGIEKSVASLWDPEMNPFGSKQPRETATAKVGQEYRENAAWQAWKL
jgi:hypothetical protein